MARQVGADRKATVRYNRRSTWYSQDAPDKVVGMALSVLVVCLVTVFYEFLKMWRVWLGSGSGTQSPFRSPLASSPYSEGCHGDSASTLHPGFSQSSLAPMQPSVSRAIISNGWLLHGIQTVLQVFQVTLSYMIMLCVMSYNVWIFLGVVLGSGLGYFLAYPLLGRLSTT